MVSAPMVIAENIPAKKDLVKSIFFIVAKILMPWQEL